MLARLIPPSIIDYALSSHQRYRDFPAHTVSHYILVILLYPDVSIEEVMRIITEGMNFLGDASLRREVGKRLLVLHAHD